jgi:hypothetical protein
MLWRQVRLFEALPPGGGALLCSTAIFQSELARIRAVSVKRRIWLGVISDELRLPSKLRASVSLGI